MTWVDELTGKILNLDIQILYGFFKILVTVTNSTWWYACYEEVFCLMCKDSPGSFHSSWLSFKGKKERAEYGI